MSASPNTAPTALPGCPGTISAGAFEREFPESYAFPKKNTIVCFLNVVSLTDKRGDYYAALNSRMSKFLRETNGVAGVSNGFSDPYGACIAYMQAEAAVESGKITNPGTRLFYFRSYALINMVINSMETCLPRPISQSGCKP